MNLSPHPSTTSPAEQRNNSTPRGSLLTRSNIKKAVCASLVLLSSMQAFAQSAYLSSSFTGLSATDWIFTHSLGEGASLTAATRKDPVGDGWLRLTNNTAHQSSFVYYNNLIPTKAGLQFDFDMAIWGSTKSLGDGIGFSLFSTDGKPTAGGYGGSLGYAQRLGVGGIQGGILGVGFDVFGNFSAPTEGRIGGSGLSTNTIAVRGSMGDDNSLGYEYITGVTPAESFSTANVRSRADATIHSVRIIIPDEDRLTVQMKKYGDADYTTLIDSIDPNIELPENIRVGFTAGTGGAYSIQEIRNFQVSSVANLSPVPEPSVALLSIATGIATLLRRQRSPIETPPQR
jgi:hypothetical protein